MPVPRVVIDATDVAPSRTQLRMFSRLPCHRDASISLADTWSYAVLSLEQQTHSTVLCRLLTFNVGEHHFALFLDDVVEIVPMAMLSCEPCTPSVLSGFLNLAGTAVPVLNMARLIETESILIKTHTPVIIIRDGLRRFGVLVDCVQHIAEVSLSAIFTIQAHAFTDSAVKIEERIIPIISVERLTLAEEKARIAELQAAQQQRLHELASTQEAAA